ncbi:hypothetical protein KJ564_05965 [bacterium]|nr:hypothetical protein [bacterium]
MESAQVFSEYLAKGLWPVEIVSDGDVTFEGDDLTIAVLHPTAGTALQQDVDANPNSMVLLVTYLHVKVLLPADINGDAELELVERHGAKLKCQVMKASHHASRFSNQAELLKAVQPEIVVVTVGPNDWGYPDAGTIHRLRQNVPHLFRTDEDGTVIIETDGNTVKIIQPEGY